MITNAHLWLGIASNSKTGEIPGGGPTLNLFHAGLMPLQHSYDGLTRFRGGFFISGITQCGSCLPDNVDRRPHVHGGD